ncbi:energy transducer TonB, partial [Endobacter medicaginis]
PPTPGPIATHPAPPGPAVPDHDVGERPLNGGQPEYPEEMQDQGREGSVNVTCDVDTTGKTSNCQVTSTQGGSAFARSAMDFVSTRRYTPRVHNGVPVESRHTFHITYRLGSE